MTTLLGLDLAGKPVLVAGGGPVAARRACAMVEAGAQVTVVSPALCEDLMDLWVEGSLAWVEREAVDADVDGVWLVHAATSDPPTNARLCALADERRIWSVDASDSASGSARTPALARHAGLVVGVASVEEPDPQRVARVRDRLELALLCDAVDLRPKRRTSGPGTPHRGRVVLAGGGPGAPDLMTIRARRALSEADVVVTDRLGPASALSELPSEVEVIHVGKAPGHHPVPQEEINRILVERAQLGQTVVRLKGGDPFVFGRGGEEVSACRAHGIPVEVIPGVTSALAAPASAGIPTTHRGVVGGVLVVHGHEQLSLAAVSAVVDRSATLVVLMGVALLPDHVEQLLAAGADPATPVAIVERATTPHERVVRAPLRQVAVRARAEGICAPAVIVLGAVADEALLELPAVEES
jgi:uroporphyrin-III C-methyltransferase/precorrin-2 dehydrogenase/sirohydrochlorin ferrochelatase